MHSKYLIHYYYYYVTQEDILEEPFPTSPTGIRSHELKDEKLMKYLEEDDDFYLREVEGKELIHYHRKNYIPTSHRNRVMGWYHTYLVHPGSTRRLRTINATIHWHGIRKHIDSYVRTCPTCQVTKKQQEKYGHFPAKTAEAIPWKRANVDIIGPYTIQN